MNRAVKWLLCVLISTGASAAEPDGIEPARVAVRTKQFAQAIELLRAPANTAQPEARYLLGLALWNGVGVAADRAAAMGHLRFAAEHGHAAAAYALAAVLAAGTAGERGEASKWRQRALEAGYTPAVDPRQPTGFPLADPRGAQLSADLRFEIARYATRHDDVPLLRSVGFKEFAARRGAFGRTLVAEAAATGAASALDALLEAGAAPDLADDAGITPLMLAAGLAETRITQRLLAAGGKADTADRVGRTPLMRAASANRPAQITLLLAAGATLARLDAQGYSATDLAAQGHAESALQTLRAAGGTVTRAVAVTRRGVDATRTGALYQGWSPLLVAVSRNDAAEIRRRVAAGENLQVRTPQGASALQIAVESRAVEAATALLAAGADPLRRDGDGLNARERVVRAGDAALFDVFFPADAPVRNSESAALLALAVDRGDEAMTRSLLARGADARAVDAQGLGALHRAARRGDAGMLKLLLDRGADAAAVDARGRNALWYAGSAHSSAALDVLLSVETSASGADREGVTPLMRAVRTGDPAAVNRLLASGAARDLRALEAPLRVAASMGQSAVLELLLSRRVAVDAADEFGDTALMAAARAGHAEVCQKLLAAGANARLRNRDRTTAADLAEARGFHSLAERLKS